MILIKAKDNVLMNWFNFSRNCSCLL